MLPTTKSSSVLATDPVTFEVVKSALYAICAEMKSVIMRTSFSPLLSLSADLSCALMDAQCNVIAQGVDIPVHLGAARFTGRAILAHYPLESWQEGDAVLTNDPYEGGTHLPDMSLLTPVFCENSLVGFVLSRIHWPDVGGIAPGSSSVCDEIIKEGLRVPPIKIVEKGAISEEILRLILANVRVPGDRYGDFQAALAGHSRANTRIKELCARYGTHKVVQIIKDTLEYSRRLVSAKLAELPDCDACGSETLDGDGISAGIQPIITVNIRKERSHLVFDFTGSSACVKGPINAPLPVTASAVYYTVLSFLGGEISPNSGVYDEIEIIAPAGTVVNATYPAAVVAANTETANRLADLLLAVLAQAYPELVSAQGYGSACVYTMGGYDPIRHRDFVHYETIGGGIGATATRPGVSGMRVHMGNTMNLPIEGMESSLPVCFLNYEIIKGSGGTGLHAGGNGVRKSFKVLVDDMKLSLLGERTQSAAAGVNGGGSGRLAHFRLITADGEKVLDAKSGPHKLSTGDIVEINTAGGGAWGTGN